MQNENQYRPEATPPAVPQGQPVNPQPIYPTAPLNNDQNYHAGSLHENSLTAGNSRPPISSLFVAYFLIALAAIMYSVSLLTGFYFASWVFGGDSPGYEIALIVGAPFLALIGLVMVIMQARKKIFVSHILAMIISVFVIFSSLSSLSLLVVSQIGSDNFDSQTTESFDDSLDIPLEE